MFPKSSAGFRFKGYEAVYKARGLSNGIVDCQQNIPDEMDLRVSAIDESLPCNSTSVSRLDPLENATRKNLNASREGRSRRREKNPGVVTGKGPARHERGVRGSIVYRISVN